MPNYPYSFQLPPLNVQDIPNDGVAGEFLGINGSGVLDWLPVASGGGDMLKSENLSGLANYTTARTNIGLGTTDSPTFANLTLTSPSLASSAPVTISQTWNNAAVTFTGLKVNATSTNSAAASKLLDLQLGGVSKFSVDKSGIIALPQTGGDASALICGGSAVTNAATYIGIYGIRLDSTSSIQWSNGKNLNVLDTILLRDGAPNTLALRNGAAAQTFNVYGTYTSASVYERMFMRYNDTDLAFQVGAETLGATARPLQLWTGGASRLHITTAGNVGIGTTAPSEKLHVLGGKVLFGDPSDPTGTAGNGELTLHARSLPQLNMVANVGANAFFGLSLKANTNERAGFLVNMQSGEIKIGGTGSGGYFPTFYSNGSEVMRLSTTLNVGIGTTSPTSKLHVALNPAANYTTEKVQFGNVFFGNAVSNYSALWMGGISPALTLTNSNFVLASDGSGTILNSPAGSGITFQVNGTNRWAINTSGHFLAAADNTYDIGASGANRPRNVYVAGAVLSGGMQLAPGGAIQNTAGTGAYFNITSGASRLRFDLGGGVVWNDSVNNPLGTETVGLMRNATGVLEVNSGTLGAFRDVRCRSVIQQLPITTTITPASNGDLVVEATSNTTLTFKLKGTDGTVRTGTITLA